MYMYFDGIVAGSFVGKLGAAFGQRNAVTGIRQVVNPAVRAQAIRSLRGRLLTDPTGQQLLKGE